MEPLPHHFGEASTSLLWPQISHASAFILTSPLPQPALCAWKHIHSFRTLEPQTGGIHADICWLFFLRWIVSRHSQDECTFCCLVYSRANQLHSSFTHHDVGREWLRPMCTLGTWPAGSVDASWLMICLFVQCLFEAFSEPISSASKNCLKHIEGITVCGVCLRYFHPPAFQLYLLQQLVQELAAQLDHHYGSWLAASIFWGLPASVRFPAKIFCLRS